MSCEPKAGIAVPVTPTEIFRNIIAGVLAPGEKLNGRKGLIFAATPASDFICGTLQLAAGMNVHVFTTGRGTPYGLAECPVIKVACGKFCSICEADQSVPNQRASLRIWPCEPSLLMASTMR